LRAGGPTAFRIPFNVLIVLFALLLCVPVSLRIVPGDHGMPGRIGCAVLSALLARMLATLLADSSGRGAVVAGDALLLTRAVRPCLGGLPIEFIGAHSIA
jgi:hypothetical protein